MVGGGRLRRTGDGPATSAMAVGQGLAIRKALAIRKTLAVRKALAIRKALAVSKVSAVGRRRKTVAVEARRCHGRIFPARCPPLAVPSVAAGRGTRPVGASGITRRAGRVAFQALKRLDAPSDLVNPSQMRSSEADRSGAIRLRFAAVAAGRARCRAAWLPDARCSRGSSARRLDAW
jgi:hypothetical protein